MIDTSFRAHDSFENAVSPVYAFFEGDLVIKPGQFEPLVFDDIVGCESSQPLYVGEYKGQVYYTTDLHSIPAGLETAPLRTFLDTESFPFEVAGRALQLLTWDKAHQYCGACSSKTSHSSSEWNRTCSACGQSYYPRISPCVIMAIRKDDKILLAQRPGNKYNLYSILAGFIEPGETAEQTVAREVAEEVGVAIKNIRYISSQPWPFPGQLMLGFMADYASGELDPDLTEVENAGWFDYRDLPDCPSPNTISGRLIKQTVQEIAAEAEATSSVR